MVPPQSKSLEVDITLYTHYPLVNLQKAIENGPVEIVSFPINSMVDRSILFCKRLPEGNIH